MKVMGMSLAAIKAAGMYESYKSYSCTDSDLCWGLFEYFVKNGFPVAEFGVMDTVLRCAVKPSFTLDQNKLALHLHNTQQAKANLLATIGLYTKDDLMSNDKFAAALRQLGVEPPTKISKTTGKEAFAFSKTDPEFLDLEEHDDPKVQALVTARLGVKSTIEETRTQRLINIARLTWPGNSIPRLPVPLRYSGAHTHRLSGDWSLNMQNLPTRQNNSIRESVTVEEGQVVVVVDASQIEARLAAWFCGQDDLVSAFARGEDIYSLFATAAFGRPITKANKAERFVGKQGILGLQYGLGYLMFQVRVALDSKAQTGQEIILDDTESARVVNLYRQTYHKVPAMWRTLTNLLPRMTEKGFRHELGPLVFEHERILLPSGLYLHLHELRYENDGWRFTYGGKTKYIYGGKVLENICQSLARIIIMDCAMRIRRALGIDLKLQGHDELVYVVPAAAAEVVKAALIAEMRVRPTWGPDIPLDAEGGIGLSYGEAK
jgi:DNA polymerase I-like protein with 3'-5' exonuclease and polymerase domains